MNMMRYEPVFRRGRSMSLLNQLLEDSTFGTLLNPQSGSRSEPDALTDWLPAVDIREDETRFVLLADLPGVKPEHIEVSMDDGILTIQGSRESEHTENNSDYRRYERSSGKFMRRFTLPDTANGEAISARTNHGVLEVSIPKQPRPLARKIAVESV